MQGSIEYLQNTQYYELENALLHKFVKYREPPIIRDSILFSPHTHNFIKNNCCHGERHNNNKRKQILDVRIEMVLLPMGY